MVADGTLATQIFRVNLATSKYRSNYVRVCRGACRWCSQRDSNSCLRLERAPSWSPRRWERLTCREHPDYHLAPLLRARLAQSCYMMALQVRPELAGCRLNEDHGTNRCPPRH